MDSTEKCFQVSWVQEIVHPAPSSKGPQDLLTPLTWMFFHMKLLKVLSSPWSRIFPISLYSASWVRLLQQAIFLHSGNVSNMISGFVYTPNWKLFFQVSFISPVVASGWTCSVVQLSKYLAWEWHHGDYSCRHLNDSTNSLGTSLLKLVSGWKWTQEHTI